MNEKLFVFPEKFPGLTGAAAIQAAVDKAIGEDIRVVRITGQWELERPVRLPSYTTVILDGAVIRSVGVAFENTNAGDPESRSLAGEQKGICILGKHGAVLRCENGPQILLSNVRNAKLQGIAFEGGEGLRLEHVYYSKAQKLSFRDSRYGVYLTEGCCNNLLEDIDAETQRDAICWVGGDSAIWGRNANLYDSILCRLRAKCREGAAVRVDAGCVTAYNLFLRDITDESECGGAAVVIGCESESELRDLTVRNVVTRRIPVSVNAFCDGIYLTGLTGQQPVIHPEATRVLTEKAPAEAELPLLREEADAPYITPNDPRYFGDTDGQTIQNAVNAAAAMGAKLVIPRWNGRTEQTRWDVEKTIVLPNNIHVELLDAHLRQVDFTYCNLFANAPGAENITVSGLGNAMVDTGKPNGLKLKTAGKLGFGPITDNATFLFRDVKNLVIRDLCIHQSRWYSIYCVGCENGRISDIDLFAPPIFPDLAGIQLRSGCRDFLVENLTGLSGEELILIASQGCDQSEERKIQNIHIRNLLANVSRCHMVDILSHDGGVVENILIETLADNSLAEQKKQPAATVRIGHGEGYYESRGGVDSIGNITVRDINGRGASTLELGGCSSHVRIENIHSFGTSENSIRTALPPECSDYLMASISADPSVIQSVSSFTPKTRILDWKISGVFFRCAQASRYMRGTATSIITDKKKFIGLTLQLDRLETEDLTIRNVLIDRAGQGIRLTGKAKVQITGFCAGEFGRTPAVCGGNCQLVIDGEEVPVTRESKL